MRLRGPARIGEAGALSTFAKNAIVDQETDALNIDTAGTVFALTSQVTDASGAVLTLSGNKQ